MCALVVSCSCGSGEAAAKSGGGMVLAAAPDSPAVFSEVGAFELVERSGAKVKREDLLGRPWVASFVFTRCTGPCPKVVGTLKKLQARLEDGGARIVTFSVDPEWDSPEVLRRYAAEVGANPQRWLFLTGEEKAIRALISNSFLSAAERAPVGEAPIGQQVSHSTRLVAVDKKCRVRGFYAGESDEAVDLLVQRLAFLQGERD
jgi:cytochrome oxidase Cu insertion factor (SCO1/SenC/PrrC family)